MTNETVEIELKLPQELQEQLQIDADSCAVPLEHLIQVLVMLHMKANKNVLSEDFLKEPNEPEPEPEYFSLIDCFPHLLEGGKITHKDWPFDYNCSFDRDGFLVDENGTKWTPDNYTKKMYIKLTD